ncbi:tripartite tricarboxylate transporter TctB family protein [Planktotalea sp.]|uniref:tripartite tricarboxylate transporter TctB family protein n=1 Tax=Planktotalea sp. TaxID=2029877 RepID=UPI0025F0F6FE|nr:tripartite tricarboxylate transporter TctB family protein [Planktotalea sp.]
MLSQKTANLVFITAILIASAYFAWVAEGFVTSGLLASSGLPSKFFPQLMLALMALCAGRVGYLYLVRGHAGEPELANVFASATEARQGLSMLAVAVLCYAIWRNFGFAPMAVLLGPISLLVMGVRNLFIYITVLALTAFITAVFIYGLGIQLL